MMWNLEEFNWIGAKVHISSDAGYENKQNA